MRSPQFAQRKHEQHETDAITEDTHDPGEQDGRRRRQFGARRRAQDHVGRAGGKSLDHRNLYGIRRGKLTRQVVVDPPTKTSDRYEQRTAR